MSLILEALKKLEREKGPHERGVLVVGRAVARALADAPALLAAGAGLVLALAVLAGR